MSTIQGMWELFSSVCLPDDTPSIQHDEMYKAFFSGASVMLALVVDAIGEESETLFMQKMEGYRDECINYMVFANTMKNTENGGVNGCH